MDVCCLDTGYLQFSYSIIAASALYHMWGKDVTEITGEQIINTLLTCKKLKPAHLLKVTLLRECFSPFLNCTNGTKSRKGSHVLSKLHFIIQTNRCKMNHANIYLFKVNNRNTTKKCEICS